MSIIFKINQKPEPWGADFGRAELEAHDRYSQAYKELTLHFPLILEYFRSL